MMDSSSLARALRNLRIEKGWTLKQLEEATGVHLSYLSAIENDRRRPGLLTLKKLAEAFSDSEVGANELVKKLCDAKSVGKELDVEKPLRSPFKNYRFLKSTLLPGIELIRGYPSNLVTYEVLKEDLGFSIDWEKREISQSAAVRLDDKDYVIRITIAEVEAK